MNRPSSLRNSTAVGSGRGCSLVVRLDGLLEAVALDEPHGVERPAVVVGAQAVDRHDPGVLQPAVDLRLQDEPAAEVGLGDLVGPDLLEGDLAAEFLVAGDVDLGRGRPRGGSGGCGTGPARGEAGGVGRRRLGVAAGPGGRSGGGEAGLEVGVSDSPQVDGAQPTS